MSDWDDLDGVAQPHISGEDAERLLSGASGADPSGDLADVDAVFQALRRPAEPNELAGLESALAAFGTAAVTTHQASPHARTRTMIKRKLTSKTVATIGVVTFISAGAAAAAGVVPSPFSSPNGHSSRGADATAVTDSVGATNVVTVPALDTTPTTDKAADATQPVASSDSAVDDSAPDGTEGQGPDANGPAKFGLCTAFHARTKHDTVDTTPVESSSTVADDQPPPFRNLEEAAAAAGQTVDEFCADAVPGGKADDSADDSADQSSDNPSASAPGKAKDNPSATAPGHSGGNGNGNGHKPGTSQP